MATGDIGCAIHDQLAIYLPACTPGGLVIHSDVTYVKDNIFLVVYQDIDCALACPNLLDIKAVTVTINCNGCIDNCFLDGPVSFKSRGFPHPFGTNDHPQAVLLSSCCGPCGTAVVMLTVGCQDPCCNLCCKRECRGSRVITISVDSCGIIGACNIAGPAQVASWNDIGHVTMNRTDRSNLFAFVERTSNHGVCVEVNGCCVFVGSPVTIKVLRVCNDGGISGVFFTRFPNCTFFCCTYLGDSDLNPNITYSGLHTSGGAAIMILTAGGQVVDPCFCPTGEFQGGFVSLFRIGPDNCGCPPTIGVSDVYAKTRFECRQTHSITVNSNSNGNFIIFYASTPPANDGEVRSFSILCHENPDCTTIVENDQVNMASYNSFDRGASFRLDDGCNLCTFVFMGNSRISSWGIDACGCITALDGPIIEGETGDCSSISFLPGSKGLGPCGLGVLVGVGYHTGPDTLWIFTLGACACVPPPPTCDPPDDPDPPILVRLCIDQYKGLFGTDTPLDICFNLCIKEWKERIKTSAISVGVGLYKNLTFSLNKAEIRVSIQGILPPIPHQKHPLTAEQAANHFPDATDLEEAALLFNPRGAGSQGNKVRLELPLPSGVRLYEGVIEQLTLINIPGTDRGTFNLEFGVSWNPSFPVLRAWNDE